MKILVIDDDYSRQEDFKLVFDKIYPDWEVIYAWNSDQALEAFKEHEFDLAFFDHDLGMGSESGSFVAFQVLNNPEVYKAPKAAWVHTCNYTGGQNITAKLHSGKIPFHVESYDYVMMQRIEDRADFEEFLSQLHA